MNVRRWILAVTFLLVAVLAIVLGVMQWQQANKVATSVAALGAVAAIGVAVWAAVPRSTGPVIRVTDSGPAIARQSGKANSGVRAPAGGLEQDVVVERSSKADAGDDGDASTGVDIS